MSQAKYTLVPDKVYGMAKAVNIALWASVPVPMAVYYFGGFEGDTLMLYVFMGTTVLFLFEAMFLSKIFERIRPQYKIEMFSDYMRVNDGGGNILNLPYSALTHVDGKPADPQSDEVLLSDGPHVDIIFEFNLDKLANTGNHPDEDSLVIRNIKDEDYIVTRLQDLTRPYIEV